MSHAQFINVFPWHTVRNEYIHDTEALTSDDHARTHEQEPCHPSNCKKPGHSDSDNVPGASHRCIQEQVEQERTEDADDPIA